MRHRFFTVGVCLLAVAISPSRASAQDSTVVRGTVRDSATHQPIPLAQISITAGGPTTTTTTDTVGQFVMSVRSADTMQLRVQRIGFESRAATIRVVPGDTVRVDVALPRTAHVLKPVAVVAREQIVPSKYRYTTRFDRFFQDRASNAGGGKFFTREQLEQYGTLARALRTIAGVHVSEGVGGIIGGITFEQCSDIGVLQSMSRGSGASAGSGRGWQPTLIIDGVRHNFGVLGTLNFDDVELIEVYPSVASSPAEARGTGCGALVIFTRVAP